MQCGPSLKAELATGWPLGPVMWFLEEGGGRAGTSLRGRGRWALLRAGPRPGPPRPGRSGRSCGPALAPGCWELWVAAVKCPLCCHCVSVTVRVWTSLFLADV